MSSKNFKCEKCNKCYTSYKSLWNHNKKFHDNEVKTDVLMKVINENEKEIKCNFCNKIFSSRQSKSEHIRKACKVIKTNNNSSNNDNNEIIELKKTVDELKQFIIQNCKIHPKKLQKINKQLINNNNTINNNTINTINISYPNSNSNFKLQASKVKYLTI